MRSLIMAAILAVSVCLGLKAQIYNNFMEAGKTAYLENNYPLASYFYEEALRHIPADSLIEIYLSDARLRDANFYSGKYDDALRYGKRVIDDLGRLELTGTYRSLEDSLMVANICAERGDSLKAVRYADEVFGKALHSDLSWQEKMQLSKVGGIIMSHLGNWPMAESMYVLARDIAKQYAPGWETINAINLHGNSLYHIGKYEEALKAYEEQTEAAREAFGIDSREYHWARYCVANMLAFMDRIDDGAAVYREVIAWYRDRMLNQLRTAPSTERARYLGNMIELLENAIPFGVKAKYNRDEFTALAYECLLLTKGLLLATEKSTEMIIRENGTDAERADITALYELKSKLADLLADPTCDPKDVLNTYARVKTLDVNLANAAARYGDNTEFAAVGYEEVRNSLKDGEVLLDFADFKPKSKPRQYVCYEIRRDRKYPEVHFVCDGARLDSLLALERGRWGNLYTGEAGEDMASIVGEPLSRIIKDAETVYYVPSGVFHKLAVEAIPLGERRLGDMHAFRRLSSARELAAADAADGFDSACIYGGLTYGADIKPLVRSAQEVEDISATLGGVVDTRVRMADKGTKESFMQLGGEAPDIVHLSTHGFHYTPADPNLPVSLQGYDDAMALSGLVMSGGSLSSRRGLLTAAEVARCDLSDTAIACLASCDSGPGEVTSEGIYGLLRAFKKAGARTVVMSLWKASDVATECFMTNFYADLVNGSRDRHKAFLFARDEVRRQYPSPFYWAGFTMVD